MDAKTQNNLRKYDGFKFDFGSLNNEHTKAVKEACEILKTQGVDENIIKDLQLKFKVKSFCSILHEKQYCYDGTRQCYS